MIDIEDIVLDKIISTIESVYPSCVVYSKPHEVPESFPCAVVYEFDNTSYDRTYDIANEEHHALLSYQVDVYSTASKNEAKSIMDAIDGAMQSMKFKRTTCGQRPNADRTITRITANYIVVVQEPTEDTTGNLDYQVYRR